MDTQRGSGDHEFRRKGRPLPLLLFCLLFGQKALLDQVAGGLPEEIKRSKESM